MPERLACPPRWESAGRWTIALVAALAVHGLVLWLLLVIDWKGRGSPDLQQPDQQRIDVVLLAAGQAQSEPQFEPELEPEPEPEPTSLVHPAVPPAPPPEPSPRPAPTVTVDADQPVEPTQTKPSSAILLSHLSKYRLHDEKLLEDLPEQPPVPLSLGHINRQDLLTMLNDPLPALPFADPDTPFVFYSTGLQGEVEKLFDKITKRTSHTTKWGTKVECAYTLIIVVCGWG